MNTKKNTGININDWKKEFQDKKDYYIGDVAGTYPILFKNGHGQEKYLPAPEFQKKKAETMACVSFSHNNCVETLGNFYDLSRLFKVDFNISDRGLAKMSGTTRQGNSPNKVCETFRTKGFLFENQYPYSDDLDSWEDFYRALSSSLFAQALKNLGLIEYNHIWIRSNPVSIIDGLQRASIQSIGYAWLYDNGRGVYVDGGNSPTHAFEIFDYVYGKYWLAYDTYDEDFMYDNHPEKKDFIKKLDWNFKFGDYSKQMFIRPKVNLINDSLLFKIKTMISKFILMNFFKDKNHPELGNANGDIYICKPGSMEAKKVDDINDIKAMLEVAFAENNYFFKKTDFGEIGQYNMVDKFTN